MHNKPIRRKWRQLFREHRLIVVQKLLKVLWEVLSIFFIDLWFEYHRVTAALLFEKVVHGMRGYPLTGTKLLRRGRIYASIVSQR